MSIRPPSLAPLAALALLLASCSPAPDGPSTTETDAGQPDIPIQIDGSDSGPQPGDPWIDLVAPDRGPLEGGVEVEIRGQEFDPGVRVWFGETEAKVDYMAGTTRIFVTAPSALIPGAADVRIRNKDGSQAMRKRGFAYLAHVTADAFEPARGPHLGGTVMTVRGEGFLPGDRVLVGWRSAVSSKVVDSNTIVAITPPYTLLPDQDRVDVVVAVRHGSGLTVLDDTWEYGRVPEVRRVDPATVPMAGGDATLVGEAMGNIGTGWADGVLIQLSDGDASSSRGAKMPARDLIDPAAKPGAVPLLVDGPFGPSVLDPAFAYVDGSKLAVYGAVPDTGPTAGGTQVAILADTAGKKVTGVRFGDASAKFELKKGTLLATLPPGDKGKVALRLETVGGTATLPDGFTYYTQTKLDTVEPAEGPAAGGTSVKVRGKGFAAGCTVRFGTYLATILDVSPNGTVIEATTPRGAPGPVDVQVRCGSVQATAISAFNYLLSGPRIDAVVPASGATGGGSEVTIHGSGFVKGMTVLFGGKLGKGVNVLDSGRLRVRTPPHDPGPVTVDVVVDNTWDSLIDGYLYFSPTNPYGGTYGQPVKGTVNVTVLDIYTLKPLEKAWVQVGQPGEPGYPQYGGWTNDQGQAVFAGADLHPPITVSATKLQYSASSIVHFDATNATLLLFPWNPPSTGPGKPPTGPPYATLEGKVLDLDKYMLVPPTNCTGQAPICKFCKVDEDCKPESDSDTNTYRCAASGGDGGRCFPLCKPELETTSQAVCNKGFSCVGDLKDTSLHVCKPSIGIRRVECRTSIRSMNGVNPNPGTAAKVDEKTGEFMISSRVDELALYCVGGYDTHEGEFLPTAMGVRRHIFPVPNDTVKNLDILLNIPLKRDLDVWLDHPPKYFPAETKGKLALEAWLFLGSDGFIPIYQPPSPPGKAAGVPLVDVKDDMILPTQPLLLPKELTDTTYTYRAVASFGDSQSSPMSGTFHDGIVSPGDTNRLVRKANGDWGDSKLGVNKTLVAVLPGDGGETLFATSRGYLYRGSVADPYIIYFPPVVDIYEGPPVVMAAAGTATDATIVGEEGLIRRLKADLVVQEKGALIEDLVGVCHGPKGRVAVGIKGGLQVNPGDGWVELDVGKKAPLHGVACTPSGAVAVGDNGRAIDVDLSDDTPKADVKELGSTIHLHSVVHLSDGLQWAAGDGKPGHGAALFKRAANGTWEQGWPAGTKSQEIRPLRLIVPIDKSNLLLIDREGGIRRLGPTGLFDESPERLDVRPRAGVTLADGQTVLVGQPGLWLGPFLSIPEISSPPEIVKPSEVTVEWSVTPGPDSSVGRVHVESQGFPFWWLYVAPEVTKLKLPDFKSLKQLQVFIDGDYLARVDRIYQPGLSIDGFSTFKLEFGQWRSWSTNYRFFTMSTNGQGPPNP